MAHHLGKWDRYAQAASQLWQPQDLMVHSIPHSFSFDDVSFSAQQMHMTAVERPDIGFDHLVLIEMARGPSRGIPNLLVSRMA